MFARGSLTVYHYRGHDSLSLAVLNGIVLWGATDQTGTGYRVPLSFESDIRSGKRVMCPGKAAESIVVACLSRPTFRLILCFVLIEQVLVKKSYFFLAQYT